MATARWVDAASAFGFVGCFDDVFDAGRACAAEAAVRKQAAVQVRDVSAACAFMQVVYVLGDDVCRYVYAAFVMPRGEFGDGPMACVRQGLQSARASPFVPTPHQRRVMQKALRRGELFGVVVCPQTSQCVTKSGDAALG